MPVYDVEVCRTGYGFNTLRIEADTEEEAEAKALESAGDYYYKEKESQYEVVDITDKEAEWIEKKNG